MKRTDVLTLKDFWRPLKEKYPEAMEHYKQWINQLKLDVYWKLIFAEQNYPAKEPRFEGHSEYRHPKAHELPAFLQIGIFVQYVNEHDKYANLNLCESVESYQEIITVYFKQKQSHINHKKTDNPMDHGAY